MPREDSPGVIERLSPYGARTIDTLAWTIPAGFIAMLVIPTVRDSFFLIPATILAAVVIGVVRQQMGWYSPHDGSGFTNYD